MRPHLILLPALSILAFACGSSPTNNTVDGPPVVLTGALTVGTGGVALVDCDRRAFVLTGSLRDSILQQFRGAASLPEGQRPWITVEATDSTFSAGKVTDMKKQGPCLMDLPGTYAMEPVQDDQLVAKVHLDVSGIFSLAVAPGDGSRKDLTGSWTRVENGVLLQGEDQKLLLRIVPPDALVLEDTIPFGQALRMTRR